MARDDFDKDMDSYLEARRRGTGVKAFFNSLFASQPKPPKPIKKELEETREPPIVDTSPVIEEPISEEEPKPEHLHGYSLLSRIFSRKKEKEETEIDAKEKEELLDDLKEVAKIALKTIKEAPDEYVHNFRKSTDFLKFKSILRKRKLIK